MAEINQYPFGSLPRHTVMVGKKERGKIRGELVKLKGIADRKKEAFHPEGEVLMCELNPPLLDSAERGASDSTNARLHRLLHPEAR